MKHIFISHSSKDIVLTEKISNHLEKLGQPCWYSERDLDKRKPGWQRELVIANNCSYALVLVLTQSALCSGEVLNEISDASAQNKLIIVYCAENIALSPEFFHNLRKYEWIQAYAMNQNAAFSLLVQKLPIASKLAPKATVEIMRNTLLLAENPCFSGIQNGSYGAGLDKCLICNGPFGWSPESVFLEYVDREEFTFSSAGQPALDRQYQAFCETAEYRKIQSRGNNKTRWMLSNIYQNEKLFLSLTKTKWSMTTFWWNSVRDNIQMQQKLAAHTFRDQAPFFPNSLCLHLIIDTADDLLLCSRISVNKRNDYASTIAVTIGEQIDEVDFSFCETNNNSFIFDWCRRAMFEEFGFSIDEYPSFVDEASIRVLGLNYEGDIYNFALPVYVKLRLTFSSLLAQLANKPIIQQEFTEITAMAKEDIIRILQQSSDPEVSRLYHPSSFLRMLQYINYKYPETFLS